MGGGGGGLQYLYITCASRWGIIIRGGCTVPHCASPNAMRSSILAKVPPWYPNSTTKANSATYHASPMGVPGRGAMNQGRIGPQYPLLIIKGDNKGK